jgi:hypothetical protein
MYEKVLFYTYVLMPIGDRCKSKFDLHAEKEKKHCLRYACTTRAVP